MTASGQDQRLTKNDSDKGAAIIPIDAQPLGTKGFGRAAGRYDREDFRPSSIGRTRSGLWEPPRPSSSLQRCRGAVQVVEESSLSVSIGLSARLTFVARSPRSAKPIMKVRFGPTGTKAASF